MKEFDEESLKEGNGKDGKPVYIAYRGKVYDVSGSRFWKTGLHMKRHPAGKDLTADISAAPHGPEVLDRYPQAGILREGKPAEAALPAWAERLLRSFPFLRRHPHPMVVHFPIVFMFSTMLFSLLYLGSGYPPFEATALHCLGAGVLFIPAGILTGFLTWRLNYLAKPSKAVRIKIHCSLILMAAASASFLWRLFVPEILISIRAASVVYLLFILSLPALVAVIGWYGAKMTFPLEE
jgi:predicted heme/steroid binding protein/uncharacterized membrane protein